MKQYVHPTISYISANHVCDLYYNIINTSYDGRGRILFVDGAERLVGEKTLTKLGFIEKEEEPDTDTKWIDDALEDYKDGMMSVGSGIYDEKYIFKQAILSHLPKQWK